MQAQPPSTVSPVRKNGPSTAKTAVRQRFYIAQSGNRRSGQRKLCWKVGTGGFDIMDVYFSALLIGGATILWGFFILRDAYRNPLG